MGETSEPDPEENPMHKRTAGLILTGILATGAVAVAITPASATTSDNVVTSRLAGIKSALTGLVSDGTLTQAQADKVAGTLDSKLPKRGPGGHDGPGGRFGGMHLSQIHDAAAKALGLTTDKLNTALESGKSLAEVAKAQSVSVSSLVKAMVASAEDDLAAAVKAGKMTQAEANTMKSSLTERITDRVNGVRPDHFIRHFRGAEGSPSTEDTSDAEPGIPSSTI
jgi:hypothetical protein